MKSNVLNLIGLPQSGIYQVARMLNRHPQVTLSHADFERAGEATEVANTIGLPKIDSNEHLQIRTIAVDGFSDIQVMDALMEQEPEARCVTVLRNPIEVSFELHSGLWKGGSESEPDFDKAWELQSERCTGRSVPKHCSEPKRLQFAQFVDCLPSLSRLWSLTTHEQRCVVLWDEFVCQPKQQTAALWEFNGLEQPQYWEQRSANLGFELMFSPTGAKVRARTRDRLCDAFLEHIAQLAAVSGRDLQHWLRRSNEIIDEDVKRIAAEHPELKKTSPIELLDYRLA